MKKTQSLKLMLLGLMASASMGAWAAVGDVFPDNTSCLFFEELDGGKARVVGVTNVVNGIVTIPDQTSNPFDNSNNPLSVTEVSNDWYGKSEIEMRHYDGEGNLVKEKTTQVKDLRQWPTPFKLIVDATQLKKINALALIPLNGKINGFEVTDQAGLEEIDDFSFANPGDVSTLNENAVQTYVEKMLKAKEDADKAIEDLTFAIGRQPAIVNGKYNGKGEWAEYAGQDVYRLKKFVNTSNAWQDATDCTFVILGKEIDGTRDKFGFKQCEIWGINLTDGSLTKSPRTTARLHYQADGVTPSGDLCYCNADASVLVLGVASKLTADNVVGCDIDATTLTSTPADAVPGLQDEADAAGTLYADLLQAKADYQAIVNDPDHVSAAIKDRRANWEKIANLTKALNAAQTELGNALDNLFKAYGTRTVGENGDIPFTSTSPYAAWQYFPAGTAVAYAVENGMIDVNAEYDPEHRIKSQYEEGGNTYDRYLDENEFNAAKLIMNAMDAAGYTRKTNGGFDRPSFSNIRTVAIDKLEKYNTLLDLSQSNIAYANGKPAVDEDGKPIMVVKQDATAPYGWKYDTTQAEGMTYAQVVDAIPDALAASDAAKAALKEAKQDLAAAKDVKEALKDKDEQDFREEAALDPENYDHSYTAGVNTVLKTVDIEDAPELKEIGESAFQNCKDAVFAGTAKLPVTIEKIEDNAFSGAAKFNPVFTTLVNLKEIGNEAFANTATTDGDFADAGNLAKVGKNIFLNCAIENLMLLGTPLTEIPEGLAQCLKHTTDYPFMDACGFFYNFNDTDRKLTDHKLNAFEIEMLKPYLFKDYTDAQLAALVDTKLSQEQVDIITAKGLVKGDMKVNTSLTVASLPEAITKIQQVDGYAGVDGFVGTFERCINLATLTGGIPTGVKEIGNKAFYGTKITSFDLSALSDLYFIGAGAFAGNAELTTVTLPTAAAYGNGGLTELPAGVFECDGDLETVVINPEMQCLPAGLFKGTSIQSIDLSNTQVTVIPDLFQATADNPNTTLKFFKMPVTEYAADNYTMTRRGVRVIGDNAFAHLHALIGSDKTNDNAATNKFVIPSSVEAIGSYVFKDDQSLVNVEFTKYSKLTKLGRETFNSTPALRSVEFLTLNCIDKDEEPNAYVETIAELTGCPGLENIINENLMASFTESVIFGSVGRTVKPTVLVTQESYDALITDYYGHGYQQGYTKLVADAPTIAVKGPYKDSNGDDMWATTYYDEFAGTWVPMAAADQDGANVMVWTAYQDYDIIYAYGAKHNNGYYKIPAAGQIDKDDLVPNDLAAPGRFFADQDDLTPVTNGDGDDDDDDDDDNADFAEWLEYYISSWYGTVPTAVVEKFAKQTKKGTYIMGKSQRYQPGSAAVIITSDQNKPVNIERHSTSAFKYQSTLDWKNELKVTGRPITTNTDDDVYKFSADTDGWGFFKQVTEIAAGKVVFPMSSYQGTAYPDYNNPLLPPMASRVSIVFLDGDFTDINDVKKYVEQMKQSGDIYDMRGIKVTTPVKGKMYIQNGKKFIQN